ncbi:MAG: hypothetical protein PVH61_00090 [Candidatus Aminicenantes bacterium]|jgi:hypothetical protein
MKKMLSGEEAQQALEEYKLLREEIFMYDRQILQALAIILSASGLIIAQGFLKGDGKIFLIPIPILFLMYLYIVDKRFGIWVIGTYIAVHLESLLPGLNWESRIRLFRERSTKKKCKLIPGRIPVMTEYLLFNALIIGCTILFALFIRNRLWTVLPAIVWVFFFIKSTIFLRDLMREGAKGDRFFGAWHECCGQD